MKTDSVTFEDLAASVIAVPPLARNADLSLNPQENGKLIRHIEAAGIRTLMYGGNANFYNIPLGEYGSTLEFLADAAGADTWVIPSVGPDYGRLMDQAEVLRAASFPTTMILPQSFSATSAGVLAAVRRFVDWWGRPVVLYLKSEQYLAPKEVGQLASEGLVCGIKYAIPRENPSEDAYLGRLIDAVGRNLVISGLGERPAVVHLRDFQLVTYTSGSNCVAPRASALMWAALKSGDFDRAEELRSAFMPLEDCRDALHPIRVLHDAVTLAGIADMGPILPLLHNLEERERLAVVPVARELKAFDQALGANSDALPLAG